MASCGYYYMNGVGVAVDAAAGVAWYSRAAEAGEVAAQLNLGCCYRDGEGVAVDAAAAVKWFTRAADAGNADAMNSLAACYDEGTGVAVDFAKSIALPCTRAPLMQVTRTRSACSAFITLSASKVSYVTLPEPLN